MCTFRSDPATFGFLAAEAQTSGGSEGLVGGFREIRLDKVKLNIWSLFTCRVFKSPPPTLHTPHMV